MRSDSHRRPAKLSGVGLGLALCLGLTGCGVGGQSAAPAPSSPARLVPARPTSSPLPTPAPASTAPAASRAPASGAPAVGATVRLIAFRNPAEGWLLVGQGPSLAAPLSLYRTTDGGRHWILEAPGTPAHPLFAAGSLPLALEFPTARRGFAVVNAGVGACQARFVLYATADGGTHWTARGSIVGSDGPVAISRATVSAPMWLANGSCAAPITGVWESTDAGASWKALAAVAGPAAAQGGGPTAVALLPRAHGAELFAAYVTYTAKGQPLRAYLAVTGLPGTASTTRVLPFPHRVTALAFVSPATGWAETRQGLYRTADGGATWQPVPTPVDFSRLGGFPGIALTGSAASPVGWLAAGTRLWETVDGGRHWLSIRLP